MNRVYVWAGVFTSVRLEQSVVQKGMHDKDPGDIRENNCSIFSPLLILASPYLPHCGPHGLGALSLVRECVLQMGGMQAKVKSSADTHAGFLPV